MGLGFQVSNTELKTEQNVSKTEVKIKTTSNLKLFLKFSYILILPMICYAYFLIYQANISTYYTNSSLVLQKNLNLKNAIITIVKNAQKFYQASMLQRITTTPPKWNVSFSKSVLMNVDIQLPSEFDSYIQKQKKILNYDLCANLVPTTDLLFENISCYNILDGVMSKGLTQTFNLYTDLIDTYGVTLMSQFINKYHPNATYPVFMEISYIRQALCSILINLHSQYNTTAFNYMKNQNDKITGDLIKGLMLMPFFLTFVAYILYSVYRESQAVIKSFRVLPKNFLLNIKTTKFLKNEEILDKIQMISL